MTNRDELEHVIEKYLDAVKECFSNGYFPKATAIVGTNVDPNTNDKMRCVVDVDIQEALEQFTILELQEYFKHYTAIYDARWILFIVPGTITFENEGVKDSIIFISDLINEYAVSHVALLAIDENENVFVDEFKEFIGNGSLNPLRNILAKPALNQLN
jgi:hypothetical protein